MKPTQRIAAIDIFRALTMFLMIFVNDLWTLFDVPEWLEHAKRGEGRLGLADWVFPGFLFIVGLSIPLAINARRNKGQSDGMIFRHIVTRSFSLIVMGFYMVNFENINGDLLPISKYIWELLMASAIVLIWNVYPSSKVFDKILVWAMQGLGIIVLIYISMIYKSGTPDDPHWLRPHWWGILGIIGWAYLLCATIYLFAGHRLLIIGLFMLVFHALNALTFIGPELMKFRLFVSPTFHASVITGVFTSLVHLRNGKEGKSRTFLAIILSMAAIFIAYAIITRPLWGISKLGGTPSWTAICAGISLAAFTLLYYVTDILKKTKWAAIIKPAGTATLTCYLLPYFWYPVMMLVGVFLPEFLRTGLIGIIKSLLFALIIILIAGLLSKIHIRLRV